MAVVLGGAYILSRFLILGKADGQVIRKVSTADNGGAGMHTHLAHATLQGLGVFKHLLVNLRAVFELFNELRHQAVTVLEVNLYVYVFHALLEGLFHLHQLTVLLFLHFFFHHLETGLQFVQLGVEGVFLLLFLAQAVRDHLGEAVAFVYAHVADARHILDGALGRHGAEGNHAGNVAGPVLFFHVFVGLAKVFKVHVYIRHGNTVRIEETLKQELVFDRVQIGDAKAVGNHGTCGGATARAHHAAHGAGGGYIVLHNEEIVREAHAADGLELKVYAFILLRCKGFPVTLVGALVG